MNVRSQVDFGRHGHGNGLELRPHAEEFSGHAHERDADHVDDPPAQGVADVAIVEPTGQDVEQMHRAREIQAQLGPLHHVPQGKRTGNNKVRKLYCNYYY